MASPMKGAYFAPGMSADMIAELQQELFRPKGALGIDMPGRMVFPLLGKRQILFQLIAGKTFARLRNKVKFSPLSTHRQERELVSLARS